MALNDLERKRKLGAIRTGICRAKEKGDHKLIAFLERKRDLLKQQK